MSAYDVWKTSDPREKEWAKEDKRQDAVEKELETIHADPVGLIGGELEPEQTEAVLAAVEKVSRAKAGATNWHGDAVLRDAIEALIGTWRSAEYAVAEARVNARADSDPT